MKYCFNAIYFTRFISVNSVIVSSIISCNDLYQDFIIMYVWYFVSRNSISVLGAIWPSLSPCTVINPISVNSVIVSSIISCNDLYQDFIIMYVWYFVSRNSISVLGAIWPSLSPCTVINPILLTYFRICSSQ